jgi:hypothetical protein
MRGRPFAEQRERERHRLQYRCPGAIKVVQGFRPEKYEIDRFGIENKRSLRTGLQGRPARGKVALDGRGDGGDGERPCDQVAARRVMRSLSPATCSCS